jgi:glycine oxidase
VTAGADTTIIGGGIIGCAIARELARRGAGRVVVVERGTVGGEASGAAAGVLAVASSRSPRGVLFELRRASAELFPSLVRELRDETGIDPEYGGAGLIDLAVSDRDLKELRRLLEKRREQGFAAEWLDNEALRDCEPATHPEVRGAVLWPGDRAVNNGRLVEALRVSGENAGVEFRLGQPVSAIERRGTRVTSVKVGGERLPAEHLIIAAGVWSREVAALLRAKMPVRPDRGEMLALRPAEPLRHILAWREGYLVPRRSGEVLVGSTSARGEMEKIVTERSAEQLRKRAVQMVPALANAPEIRRWAGLRPISTLRRPIIAPLPGFENVTIATGHHRSGIVLAPITAKLVAELVLDGETSVDIGPFCYRKK